MGNVKEFILHVVAGILFCTAITLLFQQVSEYNHVLSILKRSYQNHQTVSMEPNEYNNEIHPEIVDVVSYSEVIASLCECLEYDIEINGHLIRRYEHTAEKIVDYGIPEQSFHKSYVYDSDGEVLKIIYQSGS